MQLSSAALCDQLASQCDCGPTLAISAGKRTICISQDLEREQILSGQIFQKHGLCFLLKFYICSEIARKYVAR